MDIESWPRVGLSRLLLTSSTATPAAPATTLTPNKDETSLCIQVSQLAHIFQNGQNLQQNGTQEKAPFSGIVFCALAVGVVCFGPSVSSRNHFLIGQNSSISQWEASIWWFQKLTVGTKRTTPQERSWKTRRETGVFCWVPFCSRSLGPFERCDWSSV